MTRFLRPILVLMGFMLLSTSALAETPFPTVQKASDEGAKCIEPTHEMRRNHMNYILHERDETMHEGVRNEPGSLAACIDCHVEPNEQGVVVDHDNKDHFCNGCHQYASVQIDCFQCHADRPQEYIKRSSHTSSIKDQLQQTLAASDASSEGVNQ